MYLYVNILIMKNIIILIIALLGLSACFRTKTDIEEEHEKQRIKDSIHADSVNKKRNTPDTTIATFKRTMRCDGKLMVTFDRVKVLSGNDAAEYAIRHKRFGNNLNVVVNHEVTLETLPMDERALVYLKQEHKNPQDTTQIEYTYEQKNYEAVEGLMYETVIEIIILHRSIIYLKQREL